MTSPVPGYPSATPYGRRGPYWSCSEDEWGNGIHTGVDYPAPTGARVVAARPGKVVYCGHGTAFGYHQVEILPGDGTRDFYAHMTTRSVPNGSRVEAGEKIGEVGAEGNATGPHLHFERHRVETGPWSCGVVVDPAPSINYHPTEEDEMTGDDWEKLQRIMSKELEQNNKDVADKVWAKVQDVTTPNGDKVSKSFKQILRETWQRVAKMDA